MFNHRFPARFLGVAAIASLGIAAAASASVTNAAYAGANGLEGLGSFSAQITYSYTSGSTAGITIVLTNTTGAATGGYITAMALNCASGVDSLSFASSSSGAFGGLAGPVSTSPFGNFDVGASTSSSWLGGGSPNSGIAVGQSVTFGFTATGSASSLAAQNASSIFVLPDGLGMAVRFRGMANGGSDKVLGEVVAPGPGALASMALLCTGRSRRRRA